MSLSAQQKPLAPAHYTALTPETVAGYLGNIPALAKRLGGTPQNWTTREVGDGNLNLVFIVEGPQSAIVVKQALPYVRLVGESWPLPLDRAHYEYLALVEQSAWAAAYLPELYHHDTNMALTVMAYLSPHIILRKGLIHGTTYPHMAEHVGKFLARTLFHTSDLYLPPAQKREKTAQFLTNTAMCKISEDLIFDEPYYDAPMNRHTSPYLDDIAQSFKSDAALKAAVQGLKARFMNCPQALLHGDLHTGSIMVTAEDTRVIDPEFAFYGPMGFDVGAIVANLFMAYFAQAAQAPTHAAWILAQLPLLWDHFTQEFTALWTAQHTGTTQGQLYHPRLFANSPALEKQALEKLLAEIFQDTLGFAGCKIIRRILGLAHVEDFESITDPALRAVGERKALEFAKTLVLHRQDYTTLQQILKTL